MLFMVERPLPDIDKKPCDGAVRRRYTAIDERTVDDPAKVGFMGNTTEWWYKEGKNHRVENGHIKRDFVRTAWFLNVKSLKQFKELKDKFGVIHVCDCLNNPDIPILILGVEKYE